MSFNRHILSELQRWKENPKRKPLILRGARQVGKTTLINTFSKKYPQSIVLNLERPKDLRYFQQFDNVNDIINALFAAHNISSDQIEQTLLFIDEIQESPEAIALLRYFYEDIPGLHVIAAGSLLEHSLRQVKSFPVGRVEYLYLHPLNFLEYLEAKMQKGALEAINKIPVEPYAHLILKDHFHEYAIIGGMPEVVSAYLEKGHISDISRIYESIRQSYKDDVEKYAKNPSDAKVIRHIINTAHTYLDRRVKFQNFGNSNYRSREVSEAMYNLNDARILQLIYPVTATDPPLIPDLKKSPRLQFLDTGLVNHELNIQTEMLALEDLNTAYKGAVIPHLITQELMSLSKYMYHKPNFWVREKVPSTAEVDLVIPYKNIVVPIEIKSAKEGKLKSLHQFIERADHYYALRLYAGAFSIEEHKTPGAKKPYLLMNLPYYLGTKLPEYIEWFVENHKL